MNCFEIIGYPLLFVAALEIALGIILLSQTPRRNPVNRSVATFSFFSAAFALCTALMYIRASLGLDFNYFARANWIGWFSIPAALQFIFYLQDERSKAARAVAFVLYPFWFVIFCLSLFTDLLVRADYSLIPYINRSGPLDVPARLFGSLLILWALYEIYRLRSSVTGIKRKQLNYFFTGILIFAGGGMFTAGFPQAFGGFGLEPGLGSYFGLPWVILTFYAIARYSLFDIRMIFSRTLSIALLSLMIAPVQIVLFKLLEPVAGAPVAIVISLPLITSFFFGTPFSGSVHAWVNNIVIKGRHDYQQILRDSTKAIVTILDLSELLDYIMNSVRTGLRVENACLYLRGDDGQYTVRHGFGSYRDMKHKRSLADIAVRWIAQKKQTIVCEELGLLIPEPAADGLRTYLKGIGAELIVPLFFKDRLQGALALGEKGGGEPYIRSDINLLEVLAGQAAVAIENARLYEDARRARESLQESEDKFSTLARTIPAAIVIHQGTKFLYANPAVESMSGFSREELQGMDFWDIVHPDYQDLIRERGLDRFYGLQAPQQYEFKIVRKNGEDRWVIMAAGIIDYAGKPATLGTLIDITDLKKLEGQLRYAQKMEAIGRLSAGVAHDFNNILSNVVGHGSLVQARLAADDPMRRNIDQILASAERATSLTRSLLTFGSKEEIKLEPHELNGLMRKMEKFLSGFLGKNIELRVLAGGGLLPVMADSGRLERVVMNLAVNARDAMPAGGALVIATGRMVMDAEFIKSRGYGQFGEYAFISVTDTGVGMDESVRKRIFEPFFTTKASGKGTGFGLSIVYDILKEHSGYVDVLSERGKGTTFTVYLPLLDRVLPAPAPGPSPARVDGHETILLAEDDEAARTYCAAGLGEAGYAVIEARDGEDAVRKFRDNKERIKLLVLDIIMPNMNGREVFEAARKIRPGVKTLFISGYAEDLLQKTGMINGNHSFLMKPASRNQLLKKVREVLDS